MQYGRVWISMTPDCDVNAGGYYCQVYTDEAMEHQIDDFCIHPEDCDCSNQEDLAKFVANYAEMYQQSNAKIHN